MLISHQKKFIFIHIYKTAGTSVRDIFLPYSRLRDRMVYEFKYSRKLFLKIVQLKKWQNDGMKQFTGFHKHAKAYEIKQKLGATTFNSYYKFTFVRNPFDFLVSLYFFIKQTKNHFAYSVVAPLKFPEFVQWYVTTNPSVQLDFVVDPCSQTRLIDYIGRFETLEEDIFNIQQKLYLPTKTTIKSKNQSFLRKCRDYQEYYDDHSKSIVEDYFKADLTQLGYGFDGLTKEIPIMRK